MFDKLPEIIEALFKVAVVNDIVLLATVIEETLELSPILFKIAGEFRKLAFHELVFLIKINGGSIFEKVAPVGSHGVELHVVFHLLSGTLEEVTEELGEGENRGAEVKGVAVFLE